MARPKEGYYDSSGSRVVGVTTVTGRFKDSGGLMFWAFNQGKLAKQMVTCDQCDNQFIIGTIDRLYQKRDEAATAGTVAHALIELFLKKRSNENEFTVDPVMDVMDDFGCDRITAEQALNAFENFLEWWEISKLSIIKQEVSLVSDTHGFGGTLDAVAIDQKGRTVLIDWKTPDGGPYVDTILQLSAYGILWEQDNPFDPIDGYHCIRFDKETADFTHSFWGELEEAKEQFLALRACYERDKSLKKRVK